MAVAAGVSGTLPEARRAGVRTLRDVAGAVLDRALVLVFPGPDSATGEDLVELNCHGGRAVVEAVQAALLDQGNVRVAEPGEFTRRALLNGRIDLAQAEGLADLLEAETEAQRRAALAASEGEVSRAIRGWLDRILAVAARVEASLDFAEEDDVAAEADLLNRARDEAAALKLDIEAVLASPPVERLREGVRVVIAGPPNSGKSTLLNLMTAREAAIVSPHSGTTRDRIEAPVVRDGVAYTLIDTAGLTEAIDPVERIGVGRAQEAIDAADLLVWLGDAIPPRSDAIWVHARADLPGRHVMPAGKSVAIRQDDVATVAILWSLLAERSRSLMPTADMLPLKHRQRQACAAAAALLSLNPDPLIAAEQLRLASRELGSVLGIDASEAILDALFSRFCLGK